jgi:hypothetical protein
MEEEAPQKAVAAAAAPTAEEPPAPALLEAAVAAAPAAGERLAPRWYFSAAELEASSPSRRDGMSERDEVLFRHQTVSWIFEIVHSCKDSLRPRYITEPGGAFGGGGGGSSGGAAVLGGGSGSGGGAEARRDLFKEHHAVIATAAVFFHRFYSRMSFKEHDRLEFAIACVLTASSVTDEAVPLILWRTASKDKPDLPQTITPLMKEFFTRGGSGSGAAGSSAAGAAGGTSGGAAVAGGPPTGPLHLITQRSEAAVNARERLVKAQRVLLNTLEFEVDIRPVTALVVEALEALQGAHEVLAEVAKKSLWDALKTTLPLQLPPEQLALGVLQFAANKVEGEAARRALNNVRYAPPSNWADVVNAQTLAPAVSQLVADAILALHATTRGYAGDTTSTHGQ